MFKAKTRFIIGGFLFLLFFTSYLAINWSLLANNSGITKICRETPIISINDNRFTISEMYFQGETTLVLTDWRRQQNKLQFYKYELNILTGEISETLSPHYNDLLDTSPNEVWQLKQISVSDNSDQSGIWLSNSFEEIQLIDYVPYQLEWNWFDNGNYLGFRYPRRRGFGYSENIVDFTKTPPEVFASPIPKPYEGFGAFVMDYAFSSSENLILVTNGGGGVLTYHDNNLYIFTMQDTPQLMNMELITGIEAVKWSSALNDFLLIKVINREIHVTGKNSLNNYVLTANSLGQTLLGEIPIPTSPERYTYNLFDHYAISPSRDKLAVSDGSSLVYVFNCID